MDINSKNLLFAIFLYFICCISARAQQISRSVISSFGCSIKTSGVYLSQTVGQSGSTEQVSNKQIALHQGFEQSSFYTKPSVLVQNVNINVYPNPNRGIFNLLVDASFQSNYDCEIYDAIGKQIHKLSGYSNNIEQINLSGILSAGTYFIHVTTSNGEIGISKLFIITNTTNQ